MNRNIASRLLYISWAQHCSRSDQTARELGGCSRMVYAPTFGSHVATVWLKYAVQWRRTVRMLRTERPTSVFVMSPPPIAGIPVALYCTRRKVPFVIDAHSGAFLNKRWRHFQALQDGLMRRAATTIVTNDALVQRVRSAGASATLIRDVPIVFDQVVPLARGSEFTVAVVASFNYDEPLGEVIEAARRLPDVRFLITGDSSRVRDPWKQSVPPNASLTGFLSVPEYGGLLQGADIVLALTTLDDTMLRAAYEAVYQGTPVVISETALLQRAFPEGAVHVAANASAIADGLREARLTLPALRQGAASLRSQKRAEWIAAKAALIQRLREASRH